MIVGRKGDPTLIRFPKGMLQELAQVANANGRSRNTEVVVRLEETLKRDRKRLAVKTEAA